MCARQLLRGDRVRLDAFDPDKDADTLAAWSHDLDYLRRINAEPTPFTAAVARKRIESWGEENDKRDAITLALRRSDGARLVGFARFEHVVWPHRTAQLKMGIGSPVDRGHGLGGETLALLLRYAFDELNLHRIGIGIAAHNIEAVRFFERRGFVEEARLRKAFVWNGRHWDDIWLGLLRPDWSAAASKEPAA